MANDVYTFNEAWPLIPGWLNIPDISSDSNNYCFNTIPEFVFRVSKRVMNAIFVEKNTLNASLKACVRYFHQIFIFSPNDSHSKTMKNAFYFI